MQLDKHNQLQKDYTSPSHLSASSVSGEPGTAARENVQELNDPLRLQERPKPETLGLSRCGDRDELSGFSPQHPLRRMQYQSPLICGGKQSQHTSFPRESAYRWFSPHQHVSSFFFLFLSFLPSVSSVCHSLFGIYYEVTLYGVYQ